MEGFSHRGKAQKQVARALQNVMQGVFAEVRTRRMEHMMKHEMPEDYLKYIGNVSMLLHTHRQPPNTRIIHKAITEPAEADSHQLHYPSQQNRFIRHSHQQKEQNFEEIPLKPLISISRKPSSCLSYRSRASVERQPSKKIISSRRKIFDNCRLIPLNRGSELNEGEERYEERITQLRKRKVKLEEAMRVFREQDRTEKIAEYKKSKENQINFTTDFKGKMLNFNPRITKIKTNDTIPFSVKFQTLVESGRSWGNWGKVSSTTRRNLFRDISSNDRLTSQVQFA